MTLNIGNSEFNKIFGEIQGIASQFGAGSLPGSTYINSVFGITGDIEQIVSGDDAQKASAIKGLMDKAMSLVEKIVNAQAEAKRKVDADKKAVKEANAEAEATKEQLNSTMQGIETEINGKIDVVNEATESAKEYSKEVETKKQAIEEQVRQIKEAQEKLKNESLSKEDKLALLSEISMCSDAIVYLIDEVEGLKESIAEASEGIEESYTELAELQGLAVEKQKDGQLQVVKNVQQAGEATTNVAKTQTEGTVEVTTGTTMTVGGKALNAIPIIGGIVGTSTDQAGQKLIESGTIKTTASLANIQSLLQGIGKIQGNTQLLETFSNSIGGALSDFNAAIGGWSDLINPVIASVGSIDNTVANLDALNTAVDEDTEALSAQQEIEDKNVNGGQSYMWMNYKDNANQFHNAGVQNNNENNDDISENDVQYGNINYAQKVTLKTPTIKFGI